MNLLQFSEHWSLRTRLSLITVLSLLLGLLPGSALLADYIEQLGVIANERQALPVNRAWQSALTALQEQRGLAAEAVSTHPERKPDAIAAGRKVEGALQAVGQALADEAGLAGGLGPRQRERLNSLREHQAALAKSLEQGPLDAVRLITAQRKLADEIFDAITELNAGTGLLLDSQPASNFAIIAGLQAAPRVQDALSELAAFARSAQVDDIGRVVGAQTRYHDHARQMMEHLQLAIESDASEVAEKLKPLLESARQQRKNVDDTLAAAAQDVNYPLDQLTAKLIESATLQTRLTAEVMAALDTQMAARADHAKLRRNVLVVLLPTALALMLFLMVRSIRQLLVPVAQMVEVTEAIAAGDLSQQIPSGRRDELGRVLRALQDMQQRLRSLVQRIQEDAGSIRVAVQEIASGNQDLAGRTEQAAARLQQTASNVQSLTLAVQHSSESAADAETLASSAAEVAERGGQVVGNVVGTMKGIEDGSRRIGDITGLIDGIAFQTNILALNAAVEAARAGDAGRGFAVVAAEVRALAQRSATAAREIKSLIAQSVERVEAGTHQANEAGEAVQAILGKVRGMSAIIHSMAEQTRAEAEQTAEVGEAVQAIDAMTQQNAALVEQAAASADSLRAQAQGMDDTVKAFRL